MAQPALTFEASQLLDTRRMKDGPLVVYWGQAGEEPAPDPPLDYGTPPRRKPWQWLLRMRPFVIELRLQPPPGMPLGEFGYEVCQRLGIPRMARPPEAEHRACWVVGGVYAREARAALGSCAKIFGELGGEPTLMITAAQVRVFDRNGPVPTHGDAVPVTIAGDVAAEGMQTERRWYNV